MAQNYNINSSFGLNVKKQNAKQGILPKIDIETAGGNLFGPIGKFVDKYENVLSGDVNKEINMYSRQAMIVSMNLKASDKNVRKFDMNI